MSHEDVPILDQAVIAELRDSIGGDDAFLAELVETYLTEGAELLEGLTAAAAAGDPAAIVRPAHTLKSTSATLGAMRLSSISRGIEDAGRAGRADRLREDVEQARATWADTVRALTLAEPAR